MNKEIAAYQDQNQYEIDERDKRIAELENEIMLIQRQNENTVERLQNELEEAKDQVMNLKRNEAVIDVYKKKVDQMADLRAELSQAEELNQKLYADIEMLQQDQENDQRLEDVVERVQ